ncbi:MAG: recombinase family protein [Candidatus Sulfotelmatobacter sp.]
MAGAVLYIRVSTAEQASTNNSLPVQEKKLRQYCERQDLEVHKTFVDAGESARTMDRPQFQLMLKYCREHRRQVSHVLVADLSRLSRNVTDQGFIFAAFHRLGIKLESVDEPMVGEAGAFAQYARTMIGAHNAFFSDSLSERTREKMKATVLRGRFPWPAPIGYLNVDKKLCADPERASLVRQAFELMASGRFSTGDAVLKLVTSLGLTTKRGQQLSKQSFARMLSNPLYTGWIVSGENRVLGNHDPLVSEDLFRSVQERLNGKARPHKKLNEDFPLRGVVRCAKCGRPLTAGWARGRKTSYPRYWCWEKRCGAVGVSREELEGQFVSLLSRLQPTAELLAELPERVAAHWQVRKAQIAVDARTLSNSLAAEKTLNQRAVMAKLTGKLSDEDFDAVKGSITEKISLIESEIKALDCERSTMEELFRQTQAQVVDLVGAWRKGNVNQQQELATALFPEGLMFSHERVFFEPANVVIQQMVWRFLEDPSNIGVPDGI